MQEQERWTQLISVIEKHKDKCFNIFITQVDPDAIGSAIGLFHLLEKQNVSVAIYYCGAIGHPQNRSLVNCFNLKQRMKPISSFEYSSMMEDCFVLVDSSLLEDSRLQVDIEVDPIIVIDHHRGSTIKEKEDNFIWIEDVGSASTLITELYVSSEQEFTEHYVPILLALGIYTDTKSLISSGSRDRKAYSDLSKEFSADELNKFIDYSLPESHFHHLSFALNHMHQKGSRLVADVGYILPENGDDISTIADYLIRLCGVSLVVISGIVKDTVRVSARSTDLSMPLDEFLKKRFGSRSGAKLAPNGRGEGGASIEFDLGFWMDEESRHEIREVITKKIRSLIFKDV